MASSTPPKLGDTRFEPGLTLSGAGRGAGVRLLLTAAIALLAALACTPPNLAVASVGGKLRSLSDSPEGKQIEQQLEREFIAGAERGDLVRGLGKYGGDLTGLQRGLVELSIAVSSPRYRELRADLLQDRLSAADRRALPGFLALIGKSPALRLVREGEWLQQHPATLQRELSVYTLLAADEETSALNQKLAQVLSRPQASEVIRRTSPLRVISLLSPLQVERLPAGAGSRSAVASSSDAGSICSATVGLAKKGVARLWDGYVRFSVFTWTVTEKVILEGVYLYNRYPPDFKDLALELAKHPTEPGPAAAEWGLDWALVSSLQHGLTSLAERIQKWLSRLQNDVDPLHPDPDAPDRRPRAPERRAGAPPSDPPGAAGGSCAPSPESPQPAPTEQPGGSATGGGGGGGGEGPLHWTGEINFHNQWAESLNYENGEPFTRAGASSARWVVNVYSPEAGTEREPGGYSYYYLPYSGSWEQSARVEDNAVGCTTTELESVEGSGSGPPPPTHDFPWREETLIEPPWLLRGWQLHLYSTPLGEKHWHRENCFENFSQTAEATPYYGVSWLFADLYETGTPKHCGMVEVPLSPKLFSAPGRIVGSRGGGGGICANAVLSWDLTVTCPSGGPPAEMVFALSCGGTVARYAAPRAARARR